MCPLSEMYDFDHCRNDVDDDAIGIQAYLFILFIYLFKNRMLKAKDMIS
jgi:hypothetical protein